MDAHQTSIKVAQDMRRTIKKAIVPVLTTIFLLPAFLSAQSLDRNAERIKNNYSNDYQNTIRKHAIDKWDDDHRMIVYEINQQADALIELISSFKSSNTNIASSAIEKWSHDGYKRQNMRKFRQMDTFNLENLIEFHCDWKMVKYEYDNQAGAKNSY